MHSVALTDLELLHRAQVRLQLQNQLMKASSGNSMYADMPYQGFRHAFVKILKEEGYWRGLMRGCGACGLLISDRIR